MGKTVAIIQARMGSTRFPGKVLKPLGDRHDPVLRWVYEAAEHARGIDKIVIATSTLTADDEIVRYCEKNRMEVFRGDELDVLDRFYQCALLHKANTVVRLTADCPFLDSNVISDVVRLRKMTNAEYASNIDPATYPDGLDVECFSFPALVCAHMEATRASDRDCVPQFISRNRDRFPAANLTCPLPDLAKERWVLDTEEDYEFCQNVARGLKYYPRTYQTILEILERRPEYRKINAKWSRNERFYEHVSTENLGRREFKRSDHLLQRSLSKIPFGTQTFSKSHIQFPASQAPLYVTHADGCRIFDVDGNDYIDMVNAILPVILGYRDPDVDLAIRRQLDNGISFSLGTKLEAELSELLCHFIPCAEMVKFGKSGTDVTTAAVRLSRAYTNRKKVLVGGYHGWADWSMAVTDRDRGIPSEVCHLSTRLGSPHQKWRWEGSHPNKIAAVIVEPNDNPEYLKELREWCTKHGIILIFDEIITGFRYDMGGAQKLFGVTPDLACFGKAMGNGMPISALVGRRDIMKLMQPPNNIFYSGTMFGETLSIAAAIATIKKMDRENVINHIWRRGDLLSQEVEDIIKTYALGTAIAITGMGPRKMLSFTNDHVRTLFMMEMAQNGVLIINSHNISYAHRNVDMKRVRIAYGRTLHVISGAIKDGSIVQRVGNHVVAAAPLRVTA